VFEKFILDCYSWFVKLLEIKTTEMINKFFILIFTLYSSELIANPQPSLWRFEFLYSDVTTHYQESQNSVLFTNRDIEQKTTKFDLNAQLYLIPPMLDVGFTYSLAGIKDDQNITATNRYQYSTAASYIGFRLPLNNDFFNLRLVGEYFTSSVLVENDLFGFRKLTGTQLYPEIEIFPFGPGSFFQISPYAKVALLSSDDSRKETTVGIKMKIPFGRNRLRYPLYAYQKAIIIKLYSTQMNLVFQREGYVPADIEYQETGLSVGFNW
jgi:hypothetical protein